MSWIQAEIDARGGSISFRDFMELALYHPGHGYYSFDNPRYGRSGDFLTAPTASPWYARVASGWVGELARTVGPVRCVDVASGDGSFLERFSLELDRDAEVELVSVERSAAMRERQRERFRSAQIEMEIVDSIGRMGCDEKPAVMHASELYDALPVHRVVRREGGLRELWVESSSDGLSWTERPAEPTLHRYFEDHGVILEFGQYAEANLEAGPLHGRLLDAAGPEAVAVVLDYGYSSNRLYNPRGRLGGSLAAYRGHILETDPLRDPGSQDLTAHVNWDDLRRAAGARGWREIGLWPLAEFLIRAGLERAIGREGLGPEAELDARTVAERQEIKRLLDPDGMGSDLKVLVQGRGEVATVVEDLLKLAAARR